MSNLPSSFALKNYSRDWDGLSIAELTEFELVSVSCANGQDEAFETALTKALNCSLPKPSAVVPAGDGSIMWTAPGQYMAMLSGLNDRADQDLQAAIGTSGYTVLQSDGWAVVRLEGGRLYDVLERFIPLDLRAAATDFAARTSAHHMAVIVVKLLDGSWLLITPRSSAQGFMQSLEHIIDHVLGDGKTRPR